MLAVAAGQCATTGQPAAIAAFAAEGLFYAGVAALWLLVIQWDLLDRLLGGPGLRHLGLGAAFRLGSGSDEPILPICSSDKAKGQGS
jgi:hypothetical protein